MKEQDAKRRKKPYLKPLLLRIQLRPEEAVLGACKISGTSGPAGVGNCSPAGPCSSQGS